MSGASASALPMWIGGLAVAGVVAAGAVFWAGREPDPAPSVAAPAVMAPAVPDPADTDPEPGAETAEAPPAPQVADPVPESQAAPETQASLPLPRIDEFRFDPRGVAVLAGRAAPGDALVVRLDGREITRADADGEGAFAAVALLDPSPEARVLTLAALGPDGTERLSPDELIIAPVAAPEPQPAPQTAGEAEQVAGQIAEQITDPAPDVPTRAAAAEPAAEAATEEVIADTAQSAASAPDTPALPERAEAAAPPGETAGPTETAAAAPDSAASAAPLAEPQTTAALMPDAAAPAAPDVQAAPAADAQAPAEPQEPAPSAVADPPAPGAGEQPAQVAILRSGPEGVDVLQAPGRAPEVPRAVALDAISYSALGDVELSGRAETGATEVRIYLDNRPVAAIPVGTGGDWRGDVPDIDAGVYTLRIDAVDPAGAVQSRVETPFKREAPEVLQAAAARSDLPVQAITVQRGATLWAIARERYGDPLLYVQVFEANRDQIRDPDLIYPGQVFTLPEQ